MTNSVGAGGATGVGNLSCKNSLCMKEIHRKVFDKKMFSELASEHEAFEMANVN